MDKLHTIANIIMSKKRANESATTEVPVPETGAAPTNATEDSAVSFEKIDNKLERKPNFQALPAVAAFVSAR